MLVLPGTPAQAAETPVTLKPAEVSQALFVAGDITRLSQVPSGVEDLVLEKALQQLYADEPALAPATAERYVQDMKASLAASSSPSQASLRLMAGNQRILSILAALERPYGSPSAELPPAAKLAITHLAALALSGSSNIFAGAETPKYFEPLADARTNLTYTSFAPATVLRATRELAARDRPFGEARDELWAAASEESVFSEWSELLKESKALRSEALTELREAVQAGHGTITEEPARLTALFTSGQTKTQEQSCEHSGSGEEGIGGESISGVPRLTCSGGALYEAAHVPRSCPEKLKCEAELEHLESQAAKQARIIAEERAAMIAAAELLRPSDNTAAALQQATAEAQTQITEEETAYANYEAEQAQKELIAGSVKSVLEGVSIGVAFGTDNYSEGISGLIGVAYEIYERTEGELQNPPPGPQEITLKDLADLSTQLAGFQQYAQEAFHALNTQVAQLSSQLARENYELKQELSALGSRLQKEQGTIFALQDQVQALFAVQTKADLQTQIEDSVGWLRRTGEPLSGPKFQEALVALKKYATEIANGALVNNSEVQPYTFEGANRQLTGKTTGEPAELSEDISYLGRFPAEQGWITAATPASLANTTFWAESSRAYAQLMLENASHSTGADIAGLKALEKEGLTLEQAEGAWSERSAGAGSKTGNAILDQAIAHFEAAVDGAGVDGTPSIQALLEQAAEKSLEKSLEQSVKTGSVVPNPTEVKLWGGAEQPFSANAVSTTKYPALKWKECGGSHGGNGEQGMPEQFIKTLPAALVDGVRLGVIGAPGSGDPLILEACRTITEGEAEETGSEEATGYEYCTSVDSPICENVFVNKTKSEKNRETVTETLTLTQGSTKYALASPATCEQVALYWTGEGEGYKWDRQTGVIDAGSEYTLNATGFTGRHTGKVSNLSANGSKVESEPHPEDVFEGPACPHEGSQTKVGVEYASYRASETPLNSTEIQALVSQQIDETLRSLQKGAYAEALSALKNPSKGSPMESLAGARALVQSYVKLGFPQALDSDMTLQSDVEGLGAQFLDPEPGAPRPLPEELTALIGSWIHRLEKAGEPGQPAIAQLVGENLIGEVPTRSSKWAGEIAEQLKPYVEGEVSGFSTGATEAVGEQPALVESTLNRLQLTRDVLSEARAPTAETLAPSGVGTSEATVRGEVDPNGGAVESCIFEYGASEAYGHSVACSTIPAGTEKAVVVSAPITNWTPEGSFHERVVLKTWGGTSYGEDVKVQLAQSTHAPSGGLVMASTGTSGATIGAFSAEELPPGVELPAGAKQIVGLLSFTVNVTPGGSARVKIELPSGSAPNALFKLVHVAGGAQEYREVPSSLYTIAANTIELTLVDGGPDDEDGVVNGVIVDPLVPLAMTTPPSPPASPTSPESPTSPASASPTSTTAPAASAQTAPSSATGDTLAEHSVHPAPRECVSDRKVTVHVAYHVSLPPGTTLVSGEIVLHGRVVARLKGRATAAVVSFAGLRKGPYEVTLVAKLSNGQTRRKTIVFHTCAAPKPKS